MTILDLIEKGFEAANKCKVIYSETVDCISGQDYEEWLMLSIRFVESRDC